MGEVSPKYRELAYRVWCEQGQHIQNAVKALKDEHDFEITRQTLSRWRDEFGWMDRAARAEVAEKERAEAVSDHVILDSLIDQKRKYEEYFTGLGVGKIDTQAVYGYNSILKTILDIKEKIAERRKEGERADQVSIGQGRAIKTPQEAVFALQDAIENKLNILLAQPESVSLKNVKDLKQALELVEKMKTQYVPKDSGDKRKGVSDTTVETIKAKILGLST